jgi:hypothetical protein
MSHLFPPKRKEDRVRKGGLQSIFVRPGHSLISHASLRAPLVKHVNFEVALAQMLFIHGYMWVYNYENDKTCISTVMPYTTTLATPRPR